MSDAPAWPANLAAFFVADQAAAGPVAQQHVLEREQGRWPVAAVHELLTFVVGEQLHAIGIRQVVEVAKLPPLTRVPRMQAGVLGLMSLRGNLVPVIDAAHFFEVPPIDGSAAPGTREAADAGSAAAAQPASTSYAAGPTHLVVLGDEAAPLGLAVGRIVGVSRLPSEAVVARPQLGRDARHVDTACIESFATTPQGATVLVFRAESLLQRFAEL